MSAQIRVSTSMPACINAVLALRDMLIYTSACIVPGVRSSSACNAQGLTDSQALLLLSCTKSCTKIRIAAQLSPHLLLFCLSEMTSRASSTVTCRGSTACHTLQVVQGQKGQPAADKEPKHTAFACICAECLKLTSWSPISRTCEFSTCKTA